MTKFNVTIRADEKTLGPILASLPQDTVPEIVRLKERLSPQKVAKPAANGDATLNAKSAVLTDVLADLPAEFSGRDFRESLSRHKLHPVSANHYLRKLRQCKLVRSTGSGTAMRYHKIKKD